ncbi:hypothetical protein MPSEU_001067400 [Mayamaea pseudoterrestris]|nr:hypothetical protein MPSEU_001067400 [Mayamaea pseudoterrestris]
MLVRFLKIILLQALIVAAWGWVSQHRRLLSTLSMRKRSRSCPASRSRYKAYSPEVSMNFESSSPAVFSENAYTRRNVTSNMTDINNSSTSYFQPIFDFTTLSTIDKLERLDDAIMGGISTSSVRNGAGCARWTGVCRTDGGGFCGFRTNPFTKPLMAGSADGFYTMIRLASDNEAKRRVWKFSTRVKPDRGEQLYQAPVIFDQATPEEWSLIKIPFDAFRLVRGPKFVSEGPALNTTGGLYQIGMTMSQFEFGGDLKAMDNFRDGFFELHIKEIGLYKDDAQVASLFDVSSPQVLAKEEAAKKRPLLLKVFKPVSKIFFSESSQRRKQAMKILTKRGLTRTGAMRFGLQSRAAGMGWPKSIAKLFYVLMADLFRTSLQLTLKVSLLYPFRIVKRSMWSMISVLRSKPSRPQPKH